MFKKINQTSPMKNSTQSHAQSHEACLKINLSTYCDLFCKKNIKSQYLSMEEEKSYTLELSRLRDYLGYFNAGLMYERMLDKVLENYSENEQKNIRQSPAISLMHDSFAELLKNSVDAFLLQKLTDAEESYRCISITPFSFSSESTNSESMASLDLDIEAENTLCFSLEVTSTDKQVSLIFTDSGPGFSNDFLEKMSSEDHQIEYINQSIENKKDDYIKQKIKGLFGGKGLGLRQIICQILTGTELQPERVSTTRHPTLESEICFYNSPQSPGACIRITTQKAPLTLEELNYRIDYSDDLLEEKFEMILPSVINKNSP